MLVCKLTFSVISGVKFPLQLEMLKVKKKKLNLHHVQGI